MTSPFNDDTSLCFRMQRGLLAVA